MPGTVLTSSLVHIAPAMIAAHGPEPVHDRLTLELPDNTLARTRVFDAMGRLVPEAVSHAGRTALDLSGHQPGHYVMQVIGSEHAGTARILRW